MAWKKKEEANQTASPLPQTPQTPQVIQKAVEQKELFSIESIPIEMRRMIVRDGKEVDLMGLIVEIANTVLE